MSARSRPADAIEEEAARWLLRREDPDWSAADDAALSAWLNLTIAHRAAFWRLEQGWAAADRVAALGLPTTPPHVARRGWRHATGVIAHLPRALRGGIAASLLTLFATGGIWWSQTRPSDAPDVAYRTPVGGQRLLQLADGSHVEMNTATTLRSAMGEGAREVWLDDGEAYFDIVHRPDRSFVVHAGPRTITVLGTRFIVRRAGEKVTVAVLSGRVKVEDAVTDSDKPMHSAIVSAGDVAMTQPSATLITTNTPARVDAMAAWRDGMIAFDNTRLMDAAAEFNRYSTRPIRIADPALAELRIGGSFRARDGAAFVELMRRAYNVRVRNADDVIVLSR